MRSQHGRTLLEVLLVVSIAGVTLARAVPAWAGLLAEQRLISATNALLASAQLARSTAITDRRAASLCPRGDGPACGVDFSRGWQVFRDHDGDGARDAGEDLIEEVSLSGLRLRANRQVFVWRPFGRRATNGTLTLCDPAAGAAPRAVIVSHVGRPRTARSAPGGVALTC